MPTGSEAPFPFEALVEGVASVAADGTLAAQNAAMRSLLAARGDRWAVTSLGVLPIDVAARTELESGATVCVTLDGREVELQLHDAGDQRWLLARDVDERERTAGTELAAARVRLIGDLASSIVHDLNNLLGSVMGLAALLGPMSTSLADRRLIDDMQAGAQRGANMSRVLARMLKSSPRQWTVTPVGGLVDEVLSVSMRAVSTRGVELTRVPVTSSASVRVVAAEATQALLHGLVALIEAAPRRVVVDVRDERRAIAGGRQRDCVVVRLTAEGCTQAIGGGESSPVGWQSLAGLAQRRVGGDFAVVTAADACTIDYVWAVCASG